MSPLNRRDFLSLSLLTALDAAAVRPLLANSLPQGASVGSVAKRWAAFEELPSHAIQPHGWLQLYLKRQASTLAYALADTSWPFDTPYWQGEEQAPSWWPWEQVAYWVDGATRCALTTGDQKLMDRALERIRYTLSHANGSYLGPKYMRNGGLDYNRWPHAIFFRALTALSDNGSLANIPEILSSFYLSYQDGYDIAARNTVNVETMLWCYARTGNPALLAMAEHAWHGYVTGQPHDAADLNDKAVFGGGPITAHGVTYAEMAKLPAILYAYTGKPEYLRFALAAQQRIFDHHMLVDGIPSTTEHFGTTTALDSHETCDITDHTWTWGYLLSTTGDGVWADRIERACFNAGMGAIRKDWKGLQYFSCPNQVVASESSNHNKLKHGNYWMAYQPNPGRGTACCGGNVHRLFPNYAMRMWMTTSDGGLVAAMYGASSVSANVGHSKTLVTLEQRTEYPFADTIHFTLHAAHAVTFPFKLRIPGWCAKPELSIDGQHVPMPTVEHGFITLDRRFKPGTVVRLRLPMEVKAIHTVDNGIAYECGPLVYTQALDAAWTSDVVPKWTTAEYPAWNAHTAQAWNYGIADQPLPSLERNTSEANDPWANPPCSLTVEATTLPAWTTTAPAEPNGDRLTPALPTDRPANGTKAKLRLVPLGTTELRLTIFPKI
ncbi:MAG: glycoside hydrolase family 127 protein [Acidobacteriaceae bacterium]|nr:glycoside hydrolase family 127 protein [Acidobacteriaceae bacterium]